MPVEIRELQITTVVQDTSSHSVTPAKSSPVNTDAIIAICVEQVLEIMKQKMQR